jgi:hypothetical protein
MLPNGDHTLRLVPTKPGIATINALQVFQPPGR